MHRFRYVNTKVPCSIFLRAWKSPAAHYLDPKKQESIVMFGETIDYKLLRPLTHDLNFSSEDELDSLATRPDSLDIENATSRLQKLVDRLQGHFPISETLRYLDIGCGTGDITIALAKAGCKRVTGIDLVPRLIDEANINAQRLAVNDRIDFVCQNVHEWTPSEKYDVILSHEAFEHITRPKELLNKIGGLVAPDGIAVLAFGPLFHSPFGDHMSNFFRTQIPWRGVLFSERAILRLRNERYRPTDRANQYPEIIGGLNLMRYSQFRRYVHETGWEFTFLRVNPQLERVAPLQHLSNALVRLPLVSDYFASSIYSVLRRRQPGAPHARRQRGEPDSS